MGYLRKSHCGVQVTEEDYAALSQEERKRLHELVKSMRKQGQVDTGESAEGAGICSGTGRISVAVQVAVASKSSPTPGPLLPCDLPRKAIFGA